MLYTSGFAFTLSFMLSSNTTLSSLIFGSVHDWDTFCVRS